MKRALALLLILLCSSGYTQEQIKAMLYNLLRYPSEAPTNREYILKEILGEYQPDIFMVCELESQQGANNILNVSLQDQSDSFAMAPFVYNTSNHYDLLQNLVYYNTRKFNLVQSRAIQAPYRDINHYTFTLKTNQLASEPIYLEVFLAHLKAGNTPENEQARLNMVNVFVDILEEFTHPNTYVLFAGDFNLYSSSEPAYQKIIGTETAVNMVDPLDMPGNWHENYSFRAIHTQSTRTSNSAFGNTPYPGATGGLDDRFDFIMMSENFLNSELLYYVPGTYKSFGNNGNCFNKSINDASCTGSFSANLRDKLFWMSDHLPVVATFKTTQTFLDTPTIATSPTIWFSSPNVSDHTIDISYRYEELSGKNLQVYTIFGQRIKSISLEATNTYTLDISSLSHGVYLIKLEGSSKTLKFIKR